MALVENYLQAGRYQKSFTLMTYVFQLQLKSLHPLNSTLACTTFQVRL